MARCSLKMTNTLFSLVAVRLHFIMRDSVFFLLETLCVVIPQILIWRSDSFFNLSPIDSCRLLYGATWTLEALENSPSPALLFCSWSYLMRTYLPQGMGKKKNSWADVLRAFSVDEFLMHSKGIVDLALFSSGIHNLTLEVLLFLKKWGLYGLIKGPDASVPPGRELCWRINPTASE